MSDTRDEVESALVQAFRDAGEMVTRWTLCAESIDADGHRGLWLLSPDDMHAWETIGILTYALQIEQAKANLDLIDAGADDGDSDE